MIDYARAAERRYRMGLVVEQAGIETEQELRDIIRIGVIAPFRLSLARDLLVEGEINQALRILEKIVR